MTAITSASEAAARGRSGGSGFFLPLKLALRDLRGGLSGFYIFIVCIALGAGAIGAINTLSAAIQDGIARDGRLLLGGDVDLSLMHRQANSQERDFLSPLGQVSEVATLRAMARKPDGSAQALIDLKSVDTAYPLYGSLELANGVTPQSALFDKQGAAVDQSLLDQLQLRVGDSIAVGQATVEIAAVIQREPDRLAAGPAFGARVLVSDATLQKTDLVQPGSLVRWSYRVKLDGSSPENIEEQVKERLPESGFRVRDTSDPSPGVSNALKRLTEFLTLVGLTAMLAGGIGVANAVSSFLERKRRTLAAFKVLGASQRLILWSVFLEVAIMAGIGIAAGLAIAVAIPALAAPLLKAALPVNLDLGIYPQALATSALFGILAALPFILWPLGRAMEVRPAEFLRENVENRPALPPFAFRVAAGISAAALAAAAVLLSEERLIAGLACLGLLAVFVLFWAAGTFFRNLAARVKRPRRPEIALALASMGGPGSLTRTVALSLGTGLTLLTAVSLVDASLTSELRQRLPDRAPSHFFIGIPKAELDGFRKLVQAEAPGAYLETAPMLRGQIVDINGTPAEELDAPPDAQWVLDGDRGLTFSGTVPEGSEIRAGAWWPANYTGEPLVSFEVDLANALGIKVGDTLSVNVLGRNVTARVANLRTVKWESLDLNFVMIFSPNTLAAAPFNYLGTLNWPDEAGGRSGEAEAAVVRSVAQTYPTITAVRVRDAIEAVNGVLARIMTAIRAAGSVTLLMGAIVLAGALVTAQQRRIYEAVLFKTLGASRSRIMASHLTEHLLLALSLSVLAWILGAAIAWLLTTQIMDLSFTLSVPALLQPSIFATIFLVMLGAAGTYRVLSAKPAYYLRSE